MREDKFSEDCFAVMEIVSPSGRCTSGDRLRVGNRVITAKFAAANGAVTVVDIQCKQFAAVAFACLRCENLAVARIHRGGLAGCEGRRGGCSIAARTRK